jgi:hypothetical protein
MDSNYNLINPDFHCVSQLRTIKQLQNIQNSFEQARDNIAGIKFHGNLEVDELKATSKLDKKNFVERVELLVNTHGFQTFFYIKGADGAMYSLLTHSHLFTLETVLQEHRSRAGPHVPVYDSSGCETQESLLLSRSKYDAYEKLDSNLSRLGVQSIIGKILQDDIKTRYSHLSDFLSLPGSVYFMMALEASNASVALDIDDAMDKFNNLSLSSYPGENIKSLATEALRLIKIMEGGYCLPLRLGSDLMKKVYSTSCEHFNRWIHTKLDEVRELEMTYKLKDPKLMVNDPRYATLGPIALCGFLQEKYGSLVTEKAWPALSSSLPASNLASVQVGADKDGRRCFHCQSPDHLRDTCPKLGRDVTSGSNTGGRNRRRGKGGDTTPLPPTPPPTRSPFPAWRYIEPVDKTGVVLVGDISYKWCGKCRCRATGKQGYFTTHHFTHEHVDKQVSFGNGTATVSANHSSVAPLVPLADDSFVDDSIPEDEMLVFAGPWHCSVSTPTPSSVFICTDDQSNDPEDSVIPAVWMASVSHPSAEEETVVSVEEETMGSVSVEEETVVHATVIGNVDSRNAAGDPLAIAVAVPSVPASSSSVLLFDSSYSRVYGTDPPLAIVDLDATEYYPCDTSDCNYVGPGGFNCLQCPDGIFNTALVLCHHCTVGHGYLGDNCELCQKPLWGKHLLPTSLPHQQVIDYVEEDPTCLSYIPRNLSRQNHVYDGMQFLPYHPSANWVQERDMSNGDHFIHPKHFETDASIPFEVDDFLDTNEDVFFDIEDDGLYMDWTPLGSDKENGDSNSTRDSKPLVSSALWYLSTPEVILRFAVGWAFQITRIVINWFIALQTMTCFGQFVFWTFFWDAFDVLWNSPPCCSGKPRRLRRGKREQVQFYPRHWVLLSSFMLTCGYRSLSPFMRTYEPIVVTMSRCSYIAKHVQMSPCVLWIFIVQD